MPHYRVDATQRLVGEIVVTTSHFFEAHDLRSAEVLADIWVEIKLLSETSATDLRLVQADVIVAARPLKDRTWGH